MSNRAPANAIPTTLIESVTTQVLLMPTYVHTANSRAPCYNTRAQKNAKNAIGKATRRIHLRVRWIIPTKLRVITTIIGSSVQYTDSNNIVQNEQATVKAYKSNVK